MAKIVQIPYRKTIIQPIRCVACGEETSSDKTVRREFSKTTRLNYKWSRVESITIQFRLCEACDHHSKAIPMWTFVSIGGVVLLLIGLFVFSGWLLLVYNLAVIGGTMYLAIREGRREAKNLTIDYKRRKQVAQCAQIIDISIPRAPDRRMLEILELENFVSPGSEVSKALGRLADRGFIKIRFENDAFAKDFAELNDGFTISA